MSTVYQIVPYQPRHEDGVMEIIRAEGEDWRVYWEQPNADRYRKSLSRGVTFVALADGQVCGYVRGMEDALYLYICDLLVTRPCRGSGLGAKLMAAARQAAGGKPTYVMSGSDGYYEKLGCRREGSIYLL